MKSNKILVIVGPTTTGKTNIALKLAKKLNGELIACDSRQVYKGLDIGTGKLPSGQWKINEKKIQRDDGWWAINGVKVWMYDIVDLKKQYTVADYTKEAGEIIEKILKTGKMPIIVGGTGFYLKALLEGLPNISIPVDKKLRQRLAKLSLVELQDKLKQLSPIRWQKMNQSDRQNPRRLLRSIEIISMNPYMGRSIININKTSNFDIFKIGLTAPRKVLYENVNSQVLNWFDHGIVDEVAKLMKQKVTKKRFQALGLEYGIIASYLGQREKESLEALVIKIQGKIRGYVKRQLTWFKKEKDIIWFDITEKNFPKVIEKRAVQWYYDGDDEPKS